MNENVLAVLIPSEYEDESFNSEIAVDFLFESEDYKTISIDSISELEIFKGDIDDINCHKLDGKIYYHINHIKQYLNKNFKKLSEKLQLERFDPDSHYALYRLLAKNGIITYINSSYLSLLFLPEKLKESQKKSLVSISDMIDPGMNFSCEKIGDIPVDDVNYNEILKYLELDSDRMRL